MGKKKDAVDTSAGRPRKYESGEAKGRTGVPINVRIEPELRKAIDLYRERFLQKNHITLDLTQVVEGALRAFLVEELAKPSEEG